MNQTNFLNYFVLKEARHFYVGLPPPSIGLPDESADYVITFCIAQY